MRRTLTAVVLTTTMLLGACAGGGSSEGAPAGDAGALDPDTAETDGAPDETANGDPEAPVSSGPAEPDAAVGDELVPTIVTPTAGMVDVAPVGWDGAQPVADQDAAVLVTWWSGVEPCHVLDHYAVVESEEQVEVTLFEGRMPPEDGGDGPCPEMARYTGVVVELDAPLDGRVVVDGTGS